ncbi:IS110 family transposase [Actinomycetota bacterium Odt1-20B]
MPTAHFCRFEYQVRTRVITIGIAPHKSSHTAVAIDATGHKTGQRRVVVNAGTFGQLMRWSEQWPERRFAVEGAGGLGRILAQQLAAAGEDVVDVPSTLSARARLLATGGDRKTDPADALHVAQVALFRTDLRKVTAEDQSTILRLLTERHNDLVNERTRTTNRLHAVLRDLLPGGGAARARGARPIPGRGAGARPCYPARARVLCTGDPLWHAGRGSRRGTRPNAAASIDVAGRQHDQERQATGDHGRLPPATAALAALTPRASTRLDLPQDQGSVCSWPDLHAGFVTNEPAQPIGGRLSQAAAQRVDPDRRRIDSCLAKAAQLGAQLNLVPCFEDHFPPPRVRRNECSKPLSPGLSPPLPLPLSWHRPRIAARCRNGKAN